MHVDNFMVSSIQVSPSDDFILASYRRRFGWMCVVRNRNSETESSFESVYYHIYRQIDWKLFVGVDEVGDA